MLVLPIIMCCLEAARADNFYETLGVPRHAAAKDIKKAYRQGALRWHPDKNPRNIEEATERFRNLANAFELLSDPRDRGEYDRQLLTEPAPELHAEVKTHEVRHPPALAWMLPMICRIHT
jgi:DnaJ-class molecular chaperone